MGRLKNIEEQIKQKQLELELAYFSGDIDELDKLEKEIDALQRQYTSLKYEPLTTEE